MKDIFEKTNKIIKSSNIPISVVIELTRRCNLMCIHCYSFKDESELKFPQIENIFKQLREAGCLFLTFTGGEVFCRDDFLDILSQAKADGFDLKIISNGTFITVDKVKKLKDLAISEIGISLLGATARTHDKITGIKGSFDKTIFAITELKSCGVPVHIKCTLMKDNIAEYNQVLNFARTLGITYIIDPIISPRDDGSKDVLNYRLDDQVLEKFYYQKFDSIEKDEKQEEYSPCDAGSNFAAISATGDVYPCIQIPVSAGSVLKDNFKNIWENSQILSQMREVNQKGPEDCQDCKVKSVCSRCPGLSLLEDGDLFGCSSMAKLIAGAYNKSHLRHTISTSMSDF